MRKLHSMIDTRRLKAIHRIERIDWYPLRGESQLDEIDREAYDLLMAEYTLGIWMIMQRQGVDIKICPSPLLDVRELLYKMVAPPYYKLSPKAGINQRTLEICEWYINYEFLIASEEEGNKAKHGILWGNQVRMVPVSNPYDPLIDIYENFGPIDISPSWEDGRV